MKGNDVKMHVTPNAGNHVGILLTNCICIEGRSLGHVHVCWYMYNVLQKKMSRSTSTFYTRYCFTLMFLLTFKTMLCGLSPLEILPGNSELTKISDIKSSHNNQINCNVFLNEFGR